MKSYFTSSIVFNHKSFCDKFINHIKKAKYKNITYGMAQKIVNLSFKYLYCFRSFRKANNDKFLSCHMILDSLTLDWYYQFVNKKIFFRQKWSKIKNYKDYLLIQGEINKYIQAKKSGLSKLEYEFILWAALKDFKAELSYVKLHCHVLCLLKSNCSLNKFYKLLY